MKHENMNRQKKYQSDGKTAMENQDDGELIEDHAKQTCSKGNSDQTQQQPTLYTQLLAVHDCVNDAKQQK